MPTVSVATNVVVEDISVLSELIGSMTDVLSTFASVPREYVHIHVMHSQTMSFGGDMLKPCCQVSVMVCEGQLSSDVKDKVAKALQPQLEKAFGAPADGSWKQLEAGRTQIVFPTLKLNQIAIGAGLLNNED
mmetsp:Transcript_20578/g.34447  ORF Transcript_20578/g.34447 Transcript_20578/m.34447 type:complete len:132 (-) Transcript_20578:88-483(-)|eukprot:CAMPEP_0198199298 /NCGR_PEP_ID=MMETSP1445-20131203/2615_1 /TAXON_ID=36898 /ORGANISM="Pyramimonas sp., Strain CCMP2087" /LENGTH=131 /DNA_ID=CAMNT_0043869103 /DNA_START=52 /DNA_END=447 /DNA_ORIENTATION=+